MSDVALLVLDLQRDFLEVSGRMPVAQVQVGPLLAVANALIDAATARGIPVVYVVNAFPRSQRLRNLFRRGAAVVGTPGSEMDPRVRGAAGPTFRKDRSDAFTNPALDAFLRDRGISRLFLLGVFAPACVRATARGALRKGYRVTAVSDGVGAGSEHARSRALSRMSDDGTIVASSEVVVAQL